MTSAPDIQVSYAVKDVMLPQRALVCNEQSMPVILLWYIFLNGAEIHQQSDTREHLQSTHSDECEHLPRTQHKCVKSICLMKKFIRIYDSYLP